MQCLGFYGITDSDVIGECVDQMMSNEDMILYEKACSLLSHISENTVSSMSSLVDTISILYPSILTVNALAVGSYKRIRMPMPLAKLLALTKTYKAELFCPG